MKISEATLCPSFFLNKVKNMENISLLESFSEFKDEKLIDRVTLMVILEEVFRNSLTRKFGTDENFDIIINPDKGDLEIWRNRIVVKDGEVEDPNAEIEITQARKIEPDFCLLYTSPSPRDISGSRMPSSA